MSQTEQARALLKQNIGALLEVAQKALTMTPRNILDFHNVGDTRGALQAVLAVTAPIQTSNLAAVSTNALASLNEAVSQLVTELRRLIGAAAPPNADQEHKVRTELAQLVATVLDRALPISAYIASTDQTMLVERVENANKLLEDVGRAAAQIITAAEQAKERALAAYETIKKTAAQAAVAKNAEAFSTRAGEHDKDAASSLKAVVVIALASFGAILAFVLLQELKDQATPGEIARYVILRAVGFALGSYLLVLAAKNYRAHQHLAVVNRHRAMALQTFDSFMVTAKDDPETRNVVLVEAMRAVFAPSSTGFSGEEPAGPTDRVIEIAKTIVEKGKGG